MGGVILYFYIAVDQQFIESSMLYDIKQKIHNGLRTCENCQVSTFYEFNLHSINI